MKRTTCPDNAGLVRLAETGSGGRTTQGCTPMLMKPLSPCRSPRCPNRGPGYSPTCQALVANRLLGPIHGRGVWLFGKWRDVVDQVRAFSAHGPDVPALGTAVVVSARQFARERQKPARRTVTRWTVRDRGHGWGPPIIHRRRQFALSGNPRTAISVPAVSGCPTVSVWTFRNRGRLESVSGLCSGTVPNVGP